MVWVGKDFSVVLPLGFGISLVVLSMYSPGEEQPRTGSAVTGIETLHQGIILPFTEIV